MVSVVDIPNTRVMLLPVLNFCGTSQTCQREREVCPSQGTYPHVWFVRMTLPLHNVFPLRHVTQRPMYPSRNYTHKCALPVYSCTQIRSLGITIQKHILRWYMYTNSSFRVTYHVLRGCVQLVTSAAIPLRVLVMCSFTLQVCFSLHGLLPRVPSKDACNQSFYRPSPLGFIVCFLPRHII